jgi:alpha-ketoglutarate-dependent taurine dioxygenase
LTTTLRSSTPSSPAIPKPNANSSSSGDEGAAILDYLYEHVKSPEFQVRLRWNRGDVVFWDNRVVQHYAVPDYHERRLLHRISILPRGHHE